MLLTVISLIIMVGVVIFDQVSKILVVSNMELYESLPIIKNVFNFTYIRNDGAAFGMLDNARWVFMVFSTLAIIAVIAYMFIKKPQSKLLCISLSFIVGGGIGNMIDRVRLGYVVDFLDFCAFPKLWKWTFNVADAFVVVGAFMLIFYMILDIINEAKREKEEKLEDIECEKAEEEAIADEENSSDEDADNE